MTVYTYSEARQNFSSVLDKAKVEGNVQIIRKDGQKFSISPITKVSSSPLNVAGIQSAVTTDEIISVIREFREK